VARASTTADVFNAIAESRRRDLIDCLGDSELDVSQLVSRTGWPQAVVSKHLSVLRRVELVVVRAIGRRRAYRVNGAGLKVIHDWTGRFEQHWDHHLARVKARAEAMAHSMGEVSSHESRSSSRVNLPTPRTAD